MKKRSLGNLKVNEIGLGCMGMSEFYGKIDDKESLKVLEKAYELGVNFYDTADTYGFGHNEQLLSKFIKGKREDLVIATKFGIKREEGKYERVINNSPEYIRTSCENSLKRLGIDCIDLYYVHRLNNSYQLEETIGTLAELVKEGKIKHIGLSEVSAKTLKKAHEIFPIAAVQSEYSLMTREMEYNGVFETCEENNIGFVAYSPISRGLLSGNFKNKETLEKGDFRKFSPRFSDENMVRNNKVIEFLNLKAKELNCTTAQLAIAWVMHKKPFIVPIPGTKRIKYLTDNVSSAKIHLNKEIIDEMNKVFSDTNIFGERYTEAGMIGINS